MANDERVDPSLPEPGAYAPAEANSAPPPSPPAQPPFGAYVPPELPSQQPTGGPPPPIPSPRARSGCGVVAAAVILSLIVSAFAGLAAGFLGARLGGANELSGVVARRQQVRVVPTTTDEPVVAAAAAALPAVVNIDIRSDTSKGGDSGLPKDHPGVPVIGNGSGVAYKLDGNGGTYIITNNHVVEGARQLTVQDESGRTLRGKLIGRDAETDIAVVRVDAELSVIGIGDSSKLLVGQTVVAIGSPFRLEHSVTSGVVSALGRSLTSLSGTQADVYPLVDVIQTDAAINPGNSGGALVDTRGRLIGINTAIFSESGQSGGIGFAVPANTAIRVANQLIGGKTVTHPFLGIIGQTITPELAKELKLDIKEGAYVADLARGSGADKADVRVGDIVVALDGEPIRSMEDLILQVRRKQVGDTVSLTIDRRGQRREVKVVVGDKPAEIPRSKRESPTP